MEQRKDCIVNSQAELQQKILEGIKNGYEVGPSMPGMCTFMQRKNKPNKKFCILWFCLGIIPGFIYLIYTAKRTPDDMYIIVLSNEARQRNGDIRSPRPWE